MRSHSCFCLSEDQVLAAIGNNTAWITEIVSRQDFPSFNDLTRRLDATAVEDHLWNNLGVLSYQSVTGDRLELKYQAKGSLGQATVNHQEQVLGNWPVLESPYLKQALSSGTLDLIHQNGRWRLPSDP